MGPPRGEECRAFHKNSTVLLNVGDNQKVKPFDVITSLEKQYGKGVVFACVPKSGDCYEVTLPNKEVAMKLTTGVTIDNKNLKCELLYSDVVVVSFMHLPAYVPDDEIKGNLDKIGVELKGPINRRYYSGTTVADGTRFVETKFPPSVKSLNYLMKFKTVYGPQMFKVKHNNQTKVCLQCYSDTHFIKDCPDFRCFRCGKQGHAKRECLSEKCLTCYRYPVKCICKDVEEEEEDQDVYNQTTEDEADISDGESEINGDDAADNDDEMDKNEVDDYFDDYMYADEDGYTTH